MALFLKQYSYDHYKYIVIYSFILTLYFLAKNPMNMSYVIYVVNGQ